MTTLLTRQVLFLLYHYFNAGEMYNAIRVFIAAYVWMTGFGNYLYYYKTNDFSGVRCASSPFLILKYCCRLLPASSSLRHCKVQLQPSFINCSDASAA